MRAREIRRSRWISFASHGISRKSSSSHTHCVYTFDESQTVKLWILFLIPKLRMSPFTRRPPEGAGRLTDFLLPSLGSAGFVPFAGDGYAFLLPSKYNPSKERPFPNTDVYFEDNFDQVTNISVITEKTSKSKIEDFGKPEAYLDQLGYLLGVQSYSGSTRSEGGFAANKVSTAAVLDVYTRENKGKTYYQYEILTRTADGDEGGRHQLISATVSDGTLYIMKLQSGDKRWFKGQERDLRTAMNSFTVA